MDHNCGRMNITSLTDDYTWDLISCDETLAGYAGCEIPYKDWNVGLAMESKGSLCLYMKTEEHNCGRMNIISPADDYTH